MSLNQIIYEAGDSINQNLNLKANSLRLKTNLDVPFINGMPYIGGAVNVGTANQLIQTDPTGVFVEWTSDIKVDNCEIDAQIILNGDSGTDGKIVIKSGGVPIWSTPTFTLPSIPVGTPYQILITNSLGTEAMWSSDILVDNCDITDQLKFNGSSGVDGQIVVKVAGVPVWSTPTFTLPSIPVGTPRQLLQTNSLGTSAEWTSNISISQSNFTGNMQMSGVSGVTGQALVKTSGISQAWGKVGSQYITPGTARNVLQTDSLGTSSEWTNALSLSSLNLTGNLSFNGSNGLTGQYVRKAGGAQIWSDIVPSDVSIGSANQVLVTNPTATAAEWSSDLGFNSVLFTGSTSNYQSSLGRYYSDTIDLSVYAAPTTGAFIASQGFDLTCQITIVGSLVTLTIPSFTLFNFINGVTSPGFVLLRLPADLLPAVIFTPSNNRQSSVPFVSYTTSSPNTGNGICSVYNSYFGLGSAASCIEFNLNDGTSSYDPSSYHGEGFTTSGGITMYVKYPISISWKI